MLRESLHAIRETRKGRPIRVRRPGQHSWILRLPLRMRFRQSGLHQHYSAFAHRLSGGHVVGHYGRRGRLYYGSGDDLPAHADKCRDRHIAVQLFLSPAPSPFCTPLKTKRSILFWHFLMIGGVIGAQFGAMAGQRLRGEELRALLALIVLGVACKLLLDWCLSLPNYSPSSVWRWAMKTTPSFWQPSC